MDGPGGGDGRPGPEVAAVVVGEGAEDVPVRVAVRLRTVTIVQRMARFLRPQLHGVDADG